MWRDGVRPFDSRLLRHARATRPYIALTAALSVTGTALIAAQAVLLATAISSVFSGHSLSGELLLGSVAVVAGRAAASWAQERFGHRAAGAVTRSLRANLVRHTVRLGPAGAGDP